MRIAVGRQGIDNGGGYGCHAFCGFLQNAVDLRAEGEFYFDRLAGLDRERLSKKLKVAVADPVAKEAVGHLDGGGSPLHSKEIEWSDPSLESDLAQLVTHTVSSLLPQAFHFSSPPGRAA